MKNIIALFFLTIASISFAQESNSKVKIDVSGFIDTYYSYDFDASENKDKQSFWSYNEMF